MQLYVYIVLIAPETTLRYALYLDRLGEPTWTRAIVPFSLANRSGET